MDLQKAINCGDVEAARKVTKRLLRLFVSSTFNDTQAERNHLMREIYPQLRQFCEKHGLHFDVVDLRWGIRDQITFDHKSTEICLTEVDRCYRDSIPGPCFVFLSFNRYGWQPLPRIADAAEFEHILSEIEDTEAKKVTLKWYRKDENAVPPEYVLQPMYRPGIDKDEKKCKEAWWADENVIIKTLRDAIPSCSHMSKEQKDRWIISVTEKEVRQAILRYQEAGACKWLVFQRDIEISEDLPSEEEKVLRSYVDSSQENISSLRELVRLHGMTIKPFKEKWHKEGITERVHGQYIKKFGEEFKNSMLSLIEDTLQNTPLLDDSSTEVANHVILYDKRSKEFFGRLSLIADGVNCLRETGNAGHVVVVHGISGSGKTSFMSKLLSEARQGSAERGNKEAVACIRYCGTTPQSSNVFDLMKSICQQIAIAYGKESASLPAAYEDMIISFREHMAMASEEKPLMIFIDALDQLNDQHQGRSHVKWLPSPLPNHVSVVVSVVEDIGDCFENMKTMSSSSFKYLYVPKLLSEDSMPILNGWLKQSKRTLTKQQMDHILASAMDAKEEEPTVLRLRLLFGIAVQYASYDAVEDLPITVSGLINQFLEKIETVHGDILISNVFALLATSKLGLSVIDLLDILSCNEDVLNHVLTYHQPPIRRIPGVVFIRILKDLGDYVVERGAYDKPVLSWYHRQFQEVAAKRYLRDGRERYAEILRQYFSGTMAASDKYKGRLISPHPLYWESEDKSLRFNRHKLSELPAAAIKTGSAYYIEGVLCDLPFLAAKLSAGLGRELVQDFVTALRVVKSPKVKDFYDFILSEVHFLEKHPRLILQQAINSPVGGDVVKSALSHIEDESLVLHWDAIMKGQNLVKHVNQIKGGQVCLRTLDDRGIGARKIKFRTDKYIFVLYNKNLLHLRDLYSGDILKILFLSEEVHDFALLLRHEGKHNAPYQAKEHDVVDVAFSCSDAKIYVWKFTVGETVTASLLHSIQFYEDKIEGSLLAFADGHVPLLAVSCTVCHGSRSDPQSYHRELQVWDFSCYFNQDTPKTELVTKILSPDIYPEETIWHFDNMHLCFQESVLVIDFKDFSRYSNSLRLFSLPDLKVIFSSYRSRLLDVFQDDSCSTYCLGSLGRGLEIVQLKKAENSIKETQVHKFFTYGDIFRFGPTPHHLLSFCNNSIGLFKFTKPENADDIMTREGTMMGHTDDIKTVEVHHNLVATRSKDGTLKLWDLDKLQSQKNLAAHRSRVSDCLLLPKGAGTITCSYDPINVVNKDIAQIKLWNSETGDLLASHQGPCFTQAIFSPDYSKVILYQESYNLFVQQLVNAIYLFDTNMVLRRLIDIPFKDLSGGTEIVLKKEATVNKTCFSDSGKYAVIALEFFGDRQKIIVINTSTKLWVTLRPEGSYIKGPYIPLASPYFNTLLLAYMNRSQHGGEYASLVKWDLNEIEDKGCISGEEKANVENYQVGDYSITYKNFMSVNKHDEFTTAVIMPNTIDAIVLNKSGCPTIYGIYSLFPFKGLDSSMGNVSLMKLSDCKKVLITCTQQGWIEVWNAKSLDQLASFYNGHEVTCLSIFKGREGNYFINVGDSNGRFLVLEVIDSWLFT